MRRKYYKDFAKTKILATLGPSTDSEEVMEELIEAGVDAFRLNFSHGDHSYFQMLFERIKKVCIKKAVPIAILQDLQGPKIRVGQMENGGVELKDGSILEICKEDVTGTAEKISTSYKQLSEDASIGDRILFDDGLISLTVKDIKNDSLFCEVLEGGVLKSRKGMNLPGMKLSTPSITEKDYSDLEYALNFRLDFIALSFVRKPEDIIELKEWLKKHGRKIPVIAKIEKPEAVERLEEIVDVSDGIMVARGDLGVEMPPFEVPIIQKKIIRICKAYGKLVITATQMLESMITNPVPTRAEASDVANAVLDGTDVVMLSGETSVGSYPVDAVKMMNNILFYTEKDDKFSLPAEYQIPLELSENLFDSTGKAVVDIAKQIKAKAIVVFTHHGRKARALSKFRPKVPIIAFSDNFDTLNNLNLHWGVQPFYISNIDDEEIAAKDSIELLKKLSLIKENDLLLLTAGAPYQEKGRRTWMRFYAV